MVSGDEEHFESAQAWMALGNLEESLKELEQISAKNRGLIPVLEMSFYLRAKSGQWEEALEVAGSLEAADPQSPNSSLLKAIALRGVGRDNEAYQLLLEANERYPQESGVHLNLARLCCAFGRIEEARRWAAKAVEYGDDELKEDILTDPELESVWEEH